MAKFLCRANNTVYRDAEDDQSATYEADKIVDRRGCYKKGYPVVIKPDTYRPSRSEVPPAFVVVSVPEVTEEAARNYNNSWEQTVDYNVLDANATTGVYQVEVFGNNTNVSGDASITKTQVETFLTNWNCTVDSFGTNSVTFTMALWQALQSQGFWDRDVSAFTFNLDSYTEATGIANVTVSGLSDITQAKRLIEQKGCVVISETASSVTFEAERTDIFTEFKSDVQQKTRGTWCRKQYYFSEAVIDAALASVDAFEGEVQVSWKGQVELTLVEALAAIQDKLAE